MWKLGYLSETVRWTIHAYVSLSFLSFQAILLIIGPTEDGSPSRARASAARYAKGLRDAGTDIYVVNPGYRINEDEGRTIATNLGNVRNSYYRGLNSVQEPIAQGIFGGIGYRT